MGKRHTITTVHRQLVAKHLEAGKSYATIAEALGISKGSVAKIAKEMKQAGAAPSPPSDPGDEPRPKPTVVPDDAPDYDPLVESKRLLYLAEQELTAGRRENYQKLASQAQAAYAMHVKMTPPDPVPVDEQPDMIEAANQARSKLFSQLARSVTRAQEPELDP